MTKTRPGGFSPSIAECWPSKVADEPAGRRHSITSLLHQDHASKTPAGATHGILIASEEGRHLYAKLGWRPTADVLIATTPGNTYPA